jgi:hypothetical protein
MSYEESNFGLYEAECLGCDVIAWVDDLGLCEHCSGKLDRDMIRQRAWEYSVSAFGVRPEDLEALRQATIAQYGEALELIAPEPKSRTRRSSTQGKRRL